MNKKLIYIVIGLVIIIVAIWVWFYSRPPRAEVKNYDECVKAGYQVIEGLPRHCKTPYGEMFPEDVGNALEKMNLIKLKNPRPNQEIESPLAITGEAMGNWFFEASFPIKLVDENGFTLGKTIAQAQGDWMTENFVSFRADMRFAAPSTSKGWLILEKDNPSGLPENADELKIPVVFQGVPEIGETMTVKIFLSDSRYVNEPYFDCSRTIAVERKVPKTQGIAKAAIETLLRGATENEIIQGYVSNIPLGARLQKITIENGVAKAEFDEQLEYQVGGSCRVAAIRAQITQTLKQFPTVKEVIISIDGRTEDILQP